MSSRRPARWIEVLQAVVVRPSLWVTAVGQVFRLSPTGWWRRPPFVPLPDADYVRFRVTTQHGGGAATTGEGRETGPAARFAAPDPNDVVEYLQWCRSLGASRISRSMHR